MRFTHVLIPAFPQVFKPEKKQKLDLELLKQEYNVFVDILKESGVNIIQMPTSTNQASSLYLEDAVIVVNGTALICTLNDNICVTEQQLISELEGLSWKVKKIDPLYRGKKVQLFGSDVLFTGKEIFVGIRKHGTNREGALVLSSVFCDVPVIPVQMGDKSLPLKSYISFCAENVLAVGTSKEAQNILKRVEHESTLTYKKLTLHDIEGANGIYVNGKLLFRQDHSGLYLPIEKEGVQLWPVDATQLSKISTHLSRFCIFLKNIKTINGLEITANGNLKKI